MFSHHEQLVKEGDRALSYELNLCCVRPHVQVYSRVVQRKVIVQVNIVVGFCVLRPHCYIHMLFASLVLLFR